MSGRQSRTAYAEVQMWRAAGEQAAAAGALSPQWPVAVITAGPSARGSAWDELRQAPARRSAAPRVEAIAGANHRTMLGLVYGDHAVAGVEHVVKAERRSSGAP